MEYGVLFQFKEMVSGVYVNQFTIPIILVGSGGRGQIRGLPSAKMIALLKVDEIY